jgi:hypothetical protein
MGDMLVKLYALEHDWGFMGEQAALGITIRKPIGPEKRFLVDWVCEHFSDAWASETDCATSNTPTSCFIALQEGALIGFGCYDATALGFFGPVGVLEACRGRGTGRALLLACLLDMKLKGYGCRPGFRVGGDRRSRPGRVLSQDRRRGRDSRLCAGTVGDLDQTLNAGTGYRSRSTFFAEA